jgi:hypothetical protein
MALRRRAANRSRAVSQSKIFIFQNMHETVQSRLCNIEHSNFFAIDSVPVRLSQALRLVRRSIGRASFGDLARLQFVHQAFAAYAICCRNIPRWI